MGSESVGLNNFTGLGNRGGVGGLGVGQKETVSSCLVTGFELTTTEQN